MNWKKSTPNQYIITQYPLNITKEVITFPVENKIPYTNPFAICWRLINHLFFCLDHLEWWIQGIQRVHFTFGIIRRVSDCVSWFLDPLYIIIHRWEYRNAVANREIRLVNDIRQLNNWEFILCK